MAEDLVTIIIPVYKVEPYLDRCMESVVAQTYKNLEIILVEDGSPDQCARMCDQWALRDGRVRVVHKENGGLSDARNAGIERAHGAYLAFVDSDDYIHREMIEKLWRRIKEDGSELALCGICKVGHKGGGDFGGQADFGDALWGREEFWEHFFQDGGIHLVVAWNKLYLAKLFQKERYDVGRIHEDEFILHRLISQCSRISVVGDRLYYYVQRQGSIMGQGYSPKRLLDATEALFERSRHFASQGKFAYAFVNLGSALPVLWEAYEKLDIKASPRYRPVYRRRKAEYRALRREYWARGRLWEALGLRRAVGLAAKDMAFGLSEPVLFHILARRQR